MPATGGTARTIYRGALFHPPLDLGSTYLGLPRWSPAGDTIAFAAREDARGTLRLVSADGRLRRELLEVEGNIIAWDWSPDGRQIVLVTRGENGWTGDIRLLDVATGGSRILCAEADYEYCLPVAAWVPDANALL